MSVFEQQKKQDSLWGKGDEKKLIQILTFLSFWNGFFMWINCGVYTIHMLNSGMSAAFVSVAYTVGHSCRFLGALSSKFNSMWTPIILLVISMVATVPVVVDDTTKLGFLGRT